VESSRASLTSKLGKVQEDLTISEEGKNQYNEILQASRVVYQSFYRESKGSPGNTVLESKYRESLSSKLTSLGYTTQQEVNMRCKNEKSGVVRIDILLTKGNERSILELKRARGNQGYEQLARYLLESSEEVGYLICFGQKGVRLSQLIREDLDIYLYDGIVLKKMEIFKHI
jgi:hypothetical protein